LAYLFAEALDLRLRASGSDALSEKYRSLSGGELRLIIERPRAWEYHLLARALRWELESAQGLRRDWAYGIAVGKMESLTSSEYMRLSPEKLEEAEHIAAIAPPIINEALATALGPEALPAM
jgi:hypothetical protein